MAPQIPTWHRKHCCGTTNTGMTPEHRYGITYRQDTTCTGMVQLILLWHHIYRHGTANTGMAPNTLLWQHTIDMAPHNTGMTPKIPLWHHMYLYGTAKYRYGTENTAVAV